MSESKQTERDGVLADIELLEPTPFVESEYEGPEDVPAPSDDLAERVENFNPGPYVNFIRNAEPHRVVARWEAPTDERLVECEVSLVRGLHYCGYVRAELPRALGFDEIRVLFDEYGIEYEGPSLTYGLDEELRLGFDLAHAWDLCLDTDGIPFERKAGLTSTGLGQNRHDVWDACKLTAHLAQAVVTLEARMDPESESESESESGAQP